LWDRDSGLLDVQVIEKTVVAEEEEEEVEGTSAQESDRFGHSIFLPPTANRSVTGAGLFICSND
jgi:hypothetical protein